MPSGYQWRGAFPNPELDARHGEGFGHGPRDDDWLGQVQRHSLGWVCARDGDALVGIVIDTLVRAADRRRGIGVPLIARAVHAARGAGCAWLHVDFDDHLRGHLRGFYVEACGLQPPPAGVIAL